MARPQRIEYEGAVYHVTARGHERRAIFRDDADRDHATLTQRQVADVLGIGTGAPISQQLRKLARALESNRALRRQVTAIADDLKRRRDMLKH